MAERPTHPGQGNGGAAAQTPTQRLAAGRKRRAEGRANQPPESKAARFRRLANRRVTQAIKWLTYTGNLANKSLYEYTDEQWQAIARALDEANASVHDAFTHHKPEKKGFEL